MPNKKTKHRSATSKSRRAAPRHDEEKETGGHHARLRKHHAAVRVGVGRRGKKRHKKPKMRAAVHKRSALLERLHTAVSGAKQRLSGIGRRKPQVDKPVTEQTLRNHLALKCVRRCSH